MIKRLIDWHLARWKHSKNRTPLLIRGARQVGKTHAVRKLGESFKRVVEVNFELAKDIHFIFQKDLHPERILKALEAHVGGKIVPGETLLFFDEIQEVPEAITSLRYFYELMPQLHVIAAGSLLDFTLEKIGIPVGRVASMYMYPLSFMEFLAASGQGILVEAILDGNVPFSETVHDRLINFVGEYLAIGGMPQVVAEWVSSKNAKECFNIHQTLIGNYRQDFEKYGKKHQLPYLNALYRQIPHFIGQQFNYGNIHGEYRKRELAPCIDLLVKANAIHQIYHTAGNGLPIGAEVNLEWFKLIFLDVALSQSILGLDLASWFSEPGAEFVNRGSATEAFVGQELLAYAHPQQKAELFFWKREAKSSNAEVDYLFQQGQHILPIEVKSGEKGALKSMHLFLQEHPNSPHGICFSARPAYKMEKVDGRPLYSVVSLAHEEQKQSLRALI